MVDLLPEIDVVPDDPFNSSPTDPNLMGPVALQMYRNGQELPSGHAKTPLVSIRYYQHPRLCAAQRIRSMWHLMQGDEGRQAFLHSNLETRF